MQEDNNSETITEEQGSGSPDGQETASDVASVSEVLGGVLGKKFETDESALKAVKDTFAYVGKAGKYQKAVEAVMTAKGLSEDGAVKFIQGLGQPDSATPIDTSKFVSRDEFDAANFYKDNPDLAPYKDLIENTSKGSGKSRSEVIQGEAFKTIYDKAKAHDAAEKSKSVIHSNERLGAVANKITSAREKASKGDIDGAKNDAVSAVIDAYSIGK